MTADHPFETLQVHAGQEPAPGTNARAVPIDEERDATGVRKDQIRVSVGIEHIDDIEADFEKAFDSVGQKVSAA